MERSTPRTASKGEADEYRKRRRWVWANRDYIDKITLSIVAGFPTDMTGYELRLKDFVEPEKGH